MHLPLQYFSPGTQRWLTTQTPGGEPFGVSQMYPEGHPWGQSGSSSQLFVDASQYW